MATKISQRSLNDALRASYLSLISDLLTEKGEEVLRIASGEICVPVVDAEGNEKFVQFCVKVPTGSRDDGEAFDGYGMAEIYAEKVAEAEAKRKKREAEAEEKARKIAARKAQKEALKQLDAGAGE